MQRKNWRGIIDTYTDVSIFADMQRKIGAEVIGGLTDSLEGFVSQEFSSRKSENDNDCGYFRQVILKTPHEIALMDQEIQQDIPKLQGFRERFVRGRHFPTRGMDKDLANPLHQKEETHHLDIT